MSSTSDSGSSPQQASTKSSFCTESSVERREDGGDDLDLLLPLYARDLEPPLWKHNRKILRVSEIREAESWIW